LQNESENRLFCCVVLLQTSVLPPTSNYIALLDRPTSAIISEMRQLKMEISLQQPSLIKPSQGNASVSNHVPHIILHC